MPRLTDISYVLFPADDRPVFVSVIEEGSPALVKALRKMVRIRAALLQRTWCWSHDESYRCREAFHGG